MTLSRWKRQAESIADQMQAIRRRIDGLGDAAVDIVRDDRADQVACFASNSIEGTLSLLRDLERLVMAKSRRRK